MSSGLSCSSPTRNSRHSTRRGQGLQAGAGTSQLFQAPTVGMSELGVGASGSSEWGRACSEAEPPTLEFGLVELVELVPRAGAAAALTGLQFAAAGCPNAVS